MLSGQRPQKDTLLNQFFFLVIKLHIPIVEATEMNIEENKCYTFNKTSLQNNHS